MQSKKKTPVKSAFFTEKKSEARSLYARAGVQFPGGSMQDGLIYTIYDAGFHVNRKY